MAPITAEQVTDVVVVRDLLRTGAAAEIRTASRLTQAELAAVVGVHVSAVARWEQGTRLPRPATCLRLAAAYTEILRVTP